MGKGVESQSSKVGRIYGRDERDIGAAVTRTLVQEGGTARE